MISVPWVSSQLSEGQDHHQKIKSFEVLSLAMMIPIGSEK